MENILAIVSRDGAYAHVLSEHMRNFNSLNYDILTFFDVADYESFKSDRFVAVGVIDESLSDEISEQNEGKRLILTEKRVKMPHSIFKYQSFDVISKEVGFKAHNNLGLKDYEPKIICVTSGKGGSGVSSLCLSISGAGMTLNNTLFISLDPFLILPGGLGTQEGDVSELIYEIKLKHEGFIECIDKFVRHGKDFDYITGVYCFSDLYSFGSAEACALLGGLKKHGRYDQIVIDLGSLPQATEALVKNCDNLLVIGEEMEDRTVLFTKELCRIAGEDTLKKIKYVSLPYDELFKSVELIYSELSTSKMFSFAKKLIKEISEEPVNDYYLGLEQNELGRSYLTDKYL